MRRVCLLVLIVLACGRGGPRLFPVSFEVDGSSAVIHAELADSDAERARGLMDRRTLARDRGMLFIWDTEEERSFYMYRTLIPLDVVSIRAGKVTAVTRLLPCRAKNAEECPTTPVGSIDAAVELAAGVAEDLGIRPGISVDLPDVTS